MNEKNSNTDITDVFYNDIVVGIGGDFLVGLHEVYVIEFKAENVKFDKNNLAVFITKKAKDLAITIPYKLTKSFITTFSFIIN